MATQNLALTSAPPAIFLMGPTAAGKTELAVYLAARLPLAIISVDSAQVYRGLDIGTGKPSSEILRQAPHRLLDIREPQQPYSAAEFRADALMAMAEIRANGQVPLLVGGTGLYFRALLYGLSTLPAANPLIRARLEQEATQYGLDALHARLARIDPSAAARIHPHDPQRIQRALEVWELTGCPLSAQQLGQQQPCLPDAVLKLARAPRQRSALETRIQDRFCTMLAQGLVAETQALLTRGLSPDLPALRSVGYRQVIDTLSGAAAPATLWQRGVIATRQLAKRQLTWLHSESGLEWLYDEDGAVASRALETVQRWLARY